MPPAMQPHCSGTHESNRSDAIGVGVLDTDPFLVNPTGVDGIAGTDDDNLRQRCGSPAIDSGDNSAVPPDTADLDDDANISEPTPLDRITQPRFLNDPGTADTGDPGASGPPIVDMGAFEFDPAQPPCIPGDFNCDGDINDNDLGEFVTCDTGPESPLATGCNGEDLDGDDDVDLADFHLLQLSFGSVCP